MKIVTQTDVTGGRFGDFETIKKIAAAGFDGVDYSMFFMKNDDSHPLNGDNYLEYVDTLIVTAKECGVTFEQAHAPFPSAKEGDDEYNEKIMRKLKRSVEVAGRIDAKIIVVHPVFFKENKFENNMKIYRELEPVARQFGVKIAIENMWGRRNADGVGHIVANVCSVAEEFNEYVDALPSDVFTACLDLGHCGLVGDNAGRMIRQMGNRIGCLHVHDNDNVHDSHVLPYTKSMDYEDIIDALAEIDYSGNFTLESDNFIGLFPCGLNDAALKFMYEVSKYIVNRIQEKKQK